MTAKKKNIKKLTEGFWELSRKRQESFLQELYNLSAQNKNLFQVRLGQDYTLVFEELKQDIEKNTINRIGKYRKLRLSKINETLRNAEKFALSMHQQIKLRQCAWRGMLTFIMSFTYTPDRYQESCARHLDKYLLMVKLHILETSEKNDIYEAEKAFLMDIISSGHYLPHIEDVYIKYFT